MIHIGVVAWAHRLLAARLLLLLAVANMGTAPILGPFVFCQAYPEETSQSRLAYACLHCVVYLHCSIL
jgi:hypothetical protein